ncbi:hypothetical protein GCM10009609_60490 [Pseudonocardia aurantiaca]
MTLSPSQGEEQRRTRTVEQVEIATLDRPPHLFQPPVPKASRASNKGAPVSLSPVFDIGPTV